MAYENLCMYCFEDNGGQEVCPHCGRDARAAVPQIQLLPGTLLYGERFLVGRALGQDASGIVYSALDTKRGVKIRIREFLPRESARRLNSGEVVPESGAEDAFDSGLRKLRASVEGVEDPAKRHFFFEENGTGYIAQRKAAAADGGDGEGERQGPRLALIIGVAAALVLAVAVGVIMLVNYLTNRTDTKADQPRSSVEDVWTPPASPTPTPYAAATFGAITDPELSWMDYTNPDLKGDKSDYATPTPVPTAENGFDTSKTVNANSSSGTIKQLQKLLTNLGWLPQGNITGKYDDATQKAVKDFQQYMNDTYAISPKLSVDGVAGPKTLAWLVQIDVSVKPTPTPAPITPSPTQAGKVVDENSSKEDIKAVQNALITLGVLPTNGATGIYDNATRAAVLYFQQRVNDLQGYDALDESGTADANTLAYLAYYVEQWQNRVTPTPGPTATPSGVVVDANSAPESIKYVQQMLIALGYLDGKADGAYGAKTVSAVKSFQTFVNVQHGNVVSVTGTADETTLNYLEYYYENLATPAPTTAAPTATPQAAVPEITVSGAAEYKDGVYYVGTDGVKISWKASGKLTGYGVYLTDDGGKVTRAIDSTQYTALNLPQSYLTTSGIFTFTVVAVPEGMNADDAPYASVSLALAGSAATATPAATATATPAVTATPVATATPTPAPTLKPEISVSGAQGYLDGVYQIGASGAGISWSAAGASGYSLYLTNAANEIVASTKNTALTAYAIDPASMEQGETYTFTVVAIPQGGVEADGQYTSVRLTLAEGVGTTPEPSATPAANVGIPTIAASGQLGVVEGVYWVGTDPLEITWSATGNVSGYNMTIENDKGAVISALKNTDKTGMSVMPASMTVGDVYTITVAAIPEGGTEEGAPSASIEIALYDGRTPEPTEQPVGEVSAPVITASGQVAYEGGVYYAATDALAFSWTAQGEVASYDVKLVGSDGTTVGDATGVTKTSLVVDPADMEDGVVYTLTVTAVPVGGTSADGASASAAMAKYVAPAVGVPEISVSGAASEEGGVYYAGTDSLAISWSAENAGSYSIYLTDSGKNVINSASGTKETSLTLKPGSMQDGEVYTFTVIAIPQGGAEKDGESAAVSLSKAKEKPEVGTPKISVSGAADEAGGVYYVGTETMTVSWSAENAQVYSAYLTDAGGQAIKSAENITDTSLPLTSAKMEAGQVYTLTIIAMPEGGSAADGKSASVSVMLYEEQAPEIGEPSIQVSGAEDYSNETYWVGADGVGLSWSAENAQLYSIYLTDSNGNVVKSREDIGDTSTKLSADSLAAGEIYTFTVVAMDKDGSEKNGVSANVMVALAQENEPEQPSYIDKNSSTDEIYNMQMALYNLGWLTGESGATPGTLDAATLQAVYDFQSYVSSSGINPEIEIIDPASDNPSIDAATLSTLYDADNPVKKP